MHKLTQICSVRILYTRTERNVTIVLFIAGQSTVVDTIWFYVGVVGASCIPVSVVLFLWAWRQVCSSYWWSGIKPQEQTIEVRSKVPGNKTLSTGSKCPCLYVTAINAFTITILFSDLAK